MKKPLTCFFGRHDWRVVENPLNVYDYDKNGKKKTVVDGIQQNWQCKLCYKRKVKYIY